MADKTKVEQLLDTLLGAYEETELKVTAIVGTYVNIGMDDTQIESTWAHQKRIQVQTLAREIQQTVKKLDGLDDTAQQIVLEQYLKGTGLTPTGLTGTNKQALDQMVKQLVDGLQDARLQIVRTTADDYQRIITQTTTGVAIGGRTRLESARKALSLFADKGVTGYVDSLGRKQDIRSYVSMATRTSANNALREGRLVNLSNSGSDLIIVSSVPNPSNLCAPYEREILSISGDSDKYTSLDAAKSDGLFHSNCRHSFSKYVEGVTVVGETDADKGFDRYDESQDLRNAENNTRKWKRELIVAQSSDDVRRIAKSNAKIKQWRNTAKEIADDNDLVYKPNRLSNKAAR